MAKFSNRLNFCPKCQERQLLVKIHIQEDGSKTRFEKCRNKSCGFTCCFEMLPVKEGLYV